MSSAIIGSGIGVVSLAQILVLPWAFKGNVGMGFAAGLSTIVFAGVWLAFCMVSPAKWSYESRFGICMALLFLVMIPALILATTATGALMETAESVTQACPEFWCANRAGTTGTTSGGTPIGPAAGIATVVAFIIGVVLLLGTGMQMEYLPYETRLRVLIFVATVVVLPLLAIVTTVNVALQKTIQVAIAAPPPTDPSCCKANQ